MKFQPFDIPRYHNIVALPPSPFPSPMVRLYFFFFLPFMKERLIFPTGLLEIEEEEKKVKKRKKKKALYYYYDTIISRWLADRPVFRNIIFSPPQTKINASSNHRRIVTRPSPSLPLPLPSLLSCFPVSFLLNSPVGLL